MPGVIVERLAGCIKWLPSKEELKQTEPEIEEGCYNHPVVVLSSQAHNGRVDFLIVRATTYLLTQKEKNSMRRAV